MATKPGVGTSKRRLIMRLEVGQSDRSALKLSRMEFSEQAIRAQNPCQACGACCAYSQNWPRFTTEEDAALDLIPHHLVNDSKSGMRCHGDRCSALCGRVGVATSCAIYDHRPEVCRVCMPGDAECSLARRRHGLPPLA
jgi:uncharacterized protein